MIDENFLKTLRENLPPEAVESFDRALAARRQEYSNESRIERDEVDWDKVIEMEEQGDFQPALPETQTTGISQAPVGGPQPQVAALTPTEMMGSPQLPTQITGAPQQPSVALGVPNQAVPPAAPAPEIFPETQEMINVRDGLQAELEKENFGVEYAKSGRPLPTAGDPSLLTEEDYEAGRQLLRGETPTANIKKWRDAGNAIQYRDMGGSLDG